MSVVANVAINIDGRQAQDLLKSIQGEVKKLNGTFEELDTSSKKTQGGFDGIGQKAAILAAKFFTIKAAVDTVKKSLEVAFERGATEQRLKNLTSSTGEYEAALGAAAKIANDFGISQNQASRELTDLFARLQGAGFGLKEVTEIYRGFEAIAKTTGTTNEVASRTFLQLEQALSKGKLQGQDFLSVASNMPGVLDAIAAEAGVARGELQEMGSRGEITGDLIFRALAKANEGFDGIESRLNKQQKGFNDLNTVVERLNTVIGNVFGPVLVAGIEAINIVAQELANWWEYLYKNVLPRVAEAFKPLTDVLFEAWSNFPADEILSWVQGGLLRVIDNIIVALKIVIPIVAVIVQKFNEIVTSNAFGAVLFALEKVAPLLGVTNTQVSDFIEAQKLAVEEAAKLVENYSSLPEKINEADEAQKAIENSLLRSVQAVKEQSQAIDNQIGSLERGASINAARFSAEKAINDLHGQQLNRQYNLAQTAQQRLNIAVAIFKQQVQAAGIEYKQALENIQLEIRKQELQVQAARAKYEEIKAEGQLQILKASSLEEETKKKEQLDAALKTQNNVIESERKQVVTQKEIGGLQKLSAEAQLQSKLLAAQTAIEQKLVSDNIGLSQTEAVRLSTGLRNSQTSSGQLATSTGHVANNARNSAQMFIQVANNANAAANSIANAANQQARLNALRGQSASTGGTTSVPAFAKGGVVTKPTLGLIGEAGTEYIVPEAKAANFAANYLSGARGDDALNAGGSIPAINIQTGPVMQQEGQRYVTISDLESAMQQVAGTLLGNGRTAGGRRYAGVR